MRQLARGVLLHRHLLSFGGISIINENEEHYCISVDKLRPYLVLDCWLAVLLI